MAMTLSEYVREWNGANRKISYTVIESAAGRPNSVEIRYSATKYRKRLTLEEWEKLCPLVEQVSRGTVYAATGFALFERGILELKVASLNYNYRDANVISALHWIGKELFPEESAEFMAEVPGLS